MQLVEELHAALVVLGGGLPQLLPQGQGYALDRERERGVRPSDQLKPLVAANHNVSYPGSTLGTPHGKKLQIPWCTFPPTTHTLKKSVFSAMYFKIP